MSYAAPVVMQASAVALAGRALLIEGPPGSGKTSLALALIDRGAGLIGDDGVTLTPEGGRLVASPPPNIAGLIEIRGVGLARLSVTSSAPVALILRLGGPLPERLPQPPLSRRVISGVEVPVLAFDPGQLVPGLRAEWALRMHGLPIAATSFCETDTPHRSA